MSTAAQRAYLTQYLSLIIIVLVFLVGAVFSPEASVPGKDPATAREEKRWIGAPASLDNSETLSAVTEALKTHSLGVRIAVAEDSLVRGFEIGRAIERELLSAAIPPDAIEVVVDPKLAGTSFRLYHVGE